jgi:hypothetical protein
MDIFSVGMTSPWAKPIGSVGYWGIIQRLMRQRRVIVIIRMAIMIVHSGPRDHEFWQNPIFDHDEIRMTITIDQNP